MIIDASIHEQRAAAIYADGGIYALMAYLHGLVKAQRINSSQAAHILLWTAPDDVIKAYYNNKKGR